VYLLVKNKKTKEWEIPTQTMQEKQTMLNAKNELFGKIAGGKWKISHYMAQPLLTTLRDFDEEEKSKAFNLSLHGVRCFYFLACHKEGVPAMIKDYYDDFAWVAKRELNKFIPKDTFIELAKVLWDS